MNRASYLGNLRNGPSAISKNLTRIYSAAVALTPTVKQRMDEVFTAGFHLGGAGGGWAPFLSRWGDRQRLVHGCG